ncbi:TPA: hypothetical protein KPB81_002283 [Clostridioides difficile]|jgi:hypothetical protein|uniref:Uncharacterized protein n=12 Tax=root TaxID=1 RepID=A0A0A8WJ96_9CAUD|nr:hypothetical protein [Clostridioides difficile]YP_009195789.1 hypothetical protein PHICD505_20029 [Clostridium phage phiCD505]YP_009214214.1 hypothetical protein PHIMMP03_20034 [Clostridium phage phiMMP03]YP_009830825.1 hypothetical protein HWA97_gp29 [Clostridium phage CDKM9]YP_009830905.1 hypothetical protein HWA98_gp34 [Clostridium phage CDKM15]EQI44080.1 hypothetical protein QOS_0669 [Clostridioides difficile Y184]EQK81139.1 hypothetical protein QEG_2858 [Clostridioides difficile CD127
MIYLGNFMETDEQNIKYIGMIHYKPTLLSEEELKNGILIEKLPVQQYVENKEAKLFINIDTKEVFYRYTDIKSSIEDKVNSTEQTIADLTFQLMSNGVI